MKLIIGGYGQGKTEYAQEQYSLLEEHILLGENVTLEQLKTAICVTQFHLFIRKELFAGNHAIKEQIQSLCEENKNLIVIMDEVGSGVVPIDAFERTYRETVGRVGCLLAQHASEVIRIFCGIPTQLKGTKLC